MSQFHLPDNDNFFRQRTKLFQLIYERTHLHMTRARRVFKTFSDGWIRVEMTVPKENLCYACCRMFRGISRKKNRKVRRQQQACIMFHSSCTATVLRAIFRPACMENFTSLKNYQLLLKCALSCDRLNSLKWIGGLEWIFVG